MQTLPRNNETSQVITGPDVAAAEQLADTLNLPRLQGERFPVAAGEVGILLGADAAQDLGALPLAYPDLTLPVPAASSVAPRRP